MPETIINEMIFEWDDEKSKINFQKHGINFKTAAKIFADKNRIEEIAFYDYLHEKYKTRKITKEIILNEMAYLSKLVQSFPNVIKTLDISLKEGVIF